jgi:hypothetical protein
VHVAESHPGDDETSAAREHEPCDEMGDVVLAAAPPPTSATCCPAVSCT